MSTPSWDANMQQAKRSSSLLGPSAQLRRDSTYSYQLRAPSSINVNWCNDCSIGEKSSCYIDRTDESKNDILIKHGISNRFGVSSMKKYFEEAS